tara:strand:+ start:285 stop:641 length:357 start_codon:yes stop_codon:yes gene_type:complete
MIDYVKSTVILLALDSIYLNMVSGHFNKIVKSIQGSDIKFNMSAAIACYIALAFAINYFIIKDKRPVLDAFLLGFVIYAVFDLTNMVIFKKWNLMTSLMDMTWGGILFASTTYLTYKL